MILTEDEKKIAKAYNIGYILSVHEPRLLDQIIRRNPNNDFVKSMRIGRDHREFYANIPRKDYSPDFKNGFYNGRSLAEHNPELVERLLKSKGVSKDYKRGIESAKKEFAIRSIQQKMNQEPKTPSHELRHDEHFQKGFNIGYRLGGDKPFLLNYLKNANEKYSKYLEGMQLGQEQHNYDLAKLREKDPEATLYPNDTVNSAYVQAIIEHKISTLDEVSQKQNNILHQKNTFDDVPTPKWLEKKTSDKVRKEPEKDKAKNKDIDLDR